MKREKIFQAFNWRISDIIDNLRKIASQGFTIIQVSPLQGTKQWIGPWWIYYQPTNFRIGNFLGNENDLRELCEKANEYGIRIIVDVVFNHVANAGDGLNSFIPHENVDPSIRNNPNFFHERRGIENYNDRWQVTHWGINLPDLNTSNEELQFIMIRYLHDLLGCGVKGFRFDAAKHIELPDDFDGSNFWPMILSGLKGRDLFVYGEVIMADKETVDRYTKYINVGTDGYGSDKNKLILWSFSHDEDLTFNKLSNLTRDMTINEWSNLLQDNKESHVLFYPRQFDDTWTDNRIREINEKY